ncbi:MAG: hypothetical protein R3Y24_13865 [Eubacteriales bacterium]
MIIVNQQNTIATSYSQINYGESEKRFYFVGVTLNGSEQILGEYNSLEEMEVIMNYIRDAIEHEEIMYEMPRRDEHCCIDNTSK